MAKKEKETQEKEKYIISYAELMTFLTAFFFIMMVVSEGSLIPLENKTKETLFQGGIVLVAVVLIFSILFKLLLMLKKK